MRSQSCSIGSGIIRATSNVTYDRLINPVSKTAKDRLGNNGEWLRQSVKNSDIPGLPIRPLIQTSLIVIDFDLWSSPVFGPLFLQPFGFHAVGRRLAWRQVFELRMRPVFGALHSDKEHCWT